MPSLSSVPSPAALRVLILLTFGLGGLATTPARADVPVFALEATRILPVPESDTGHTTPEVALRPDGGYLAVWADLDAGRIVGRRFGPVDASGESESEPFELTPEGVTFDGPVALGRHADGSYLAVWKGPEASSGVSARAFDAQGSPIWPTEVVVTGEVSSRGIDLAPRPGGYVLVWAEEGDAAREVWYRFLDTVGIPLGAVRVAELPAGARAPRVQVASEAGGAFTVSWSWWRNGDDAGAVEARGFSGMGQPLGPAFDLVPEGPSRFEIEHDLAAVGGGDYLLAWAAGSSMEEPAREIHGLRFAGDGGEIGSSRRLDAGDDPDRSVLHPALAFGPEGKGVVAWAEGTSDLDRPRARLVDGDGDPRSDPFDLVPGRVTGAQDFINGIDVDRDAEGRLVFGWGIGIHPGVIPTPAHRSWTSQARRFRESEEGCFPVLTLDFRTEPAAPEAGDPVTLLFEGLADCAEVSLTDWSLEDGTFLVEAEAESLVCGTVPPFPYSVPVAAGSLLAGDHDVEIEVALPEGGTCARSFGFTVEPGGPGEPPPPAPPHPDAPPLTTDALPGFRFWVAITAPDGGDTILGAKVEPCIPETLCVSGRVPGRHEVFARIVGPKPNGRLWPTLVKFTTSRVEVWIEQVATGEVEYYLLEGARPGFDELPGLFDREGFEP